MHASSFEGSVIKQEEEEEREREKGEKNFSPPCFQSISQKSSEEERAIECKEKFNKGI